MKSLMMVAALALASVFPGIPALADSGPSLLANSSHKAHPGMDGRGKGQDGQHGGGNHHGHKENQKDNAGTTTGPTSKSKPNDMLNLLLVLLIPAGVGAIGGRKLRRTRVKPAS